MGDVIDFNKRKREITRKKRLKDELDSLHYIDKPLSRDDKIKEALKKFGSHRKNKQHEKDDKDK
jgi:hypothetical protein